MSGGKKIFCVNYEKSKKNKLKIVFRDEKQSKIIRKLKKMKEGKKRKNGIKEREKKKEKKIQKYIMQIQ